MGIRGLNTFIKNEIRHGFFPVNIRDSIYTYKRLNPGLTPTIVIDLISLMNYILRNKYETLLGGRFDVYNDRARIMFSKLQSLGTNLVFFIDGPTPAEKLKTCLKRRNSKYREGIKALHAIDSGLNIQRPKFGVLKLVTFLKNFTDIAGYYGEVYTSVLNDCDQELVLLALDRKAFAIIADDSDFLIFEGKWHFWSGQNLNLKRFVTMEYNKKSLRSYLKLSEKQMTLFATLSGNDHVPYAGVQEFHRRLTIQYNCNGNRFKAIAKFIQSLNSQPPQLSDVDKKSIENQIPYFHNSGALESSLDFYCLENIKRPNDDALARFIHNPRRFNHLIFVILTNFPNYICHFICQDLSKNILTPYFDIVKPILCRMMGVLLKNEPEETDQKRSFYFRLDHNKSYELVTLCPDYPSCDVPPVLDLLSPPCGGNIDLDKVRWDLLCFIVSGRVTGSAFRKLPRENLGNVLCLFYLVERKEITEDEADCILISCNLSLEKQKSLNKNKVTNINGRDARLAFFFGRFYMLMKDCISSVGLRDYCALLKFDGLYFHYLRKTWQNSSEEFKKTELQMIRSLRLYSEGFGLL